MNKATRNNSIRNATRFEPLEGRRMMSSVQLVDGMLVLQGNAHGANRLAVSPDANGYSLFARANKVKAHFLIKDVKSIRMIGGEKNDKVSIDAAIKQNSYIRTGHGRDSVSGGSGGDTIFGGAEPDSLKGNGGDDLIIGGGQGADKIDAGTGDDPKKIWAHKSTTYAVSVSTFTLVNADTNEVIGTIGEGAVLNVAKLPKRINVLANIQPAGAKGSVKFIYDGVDAAARIENVAPFALAADNAGVLAAWNPKAGVHTLSATPYSGKNGTGTGGTGKIVTFTVINDADAHGSGLNSGTTNSGGTSTNTGGGTSTNTGGGTTTNTGGGTTNQNVAAPTAVITVMDSSVPVGNAIHVNALKSTLKSGDVLAAKYEWNFGDGSAKYNTLQGFNAAHAYTKTGTYTVSLKVTNGAGGSTTVTTKVTITAANRRMIYVSPKGNDANSGTSESAAVKTFARASQLVGDNSEVLFQRGATFDAKESMNLGHSNVVVGAYGTGNKPVLRFTGGLNYGAVLVTLGGKDVLIRDVAFDSSSTTNDDSGFNDGVRIGGTNITVRDCSFVNVGYGLNSNGFPEGVLVQDCVAPNKNSTRAYFAWVQGSDHVYLGNKALDSGMHNLRMGGADRVNISYNDFTNLASTGGLRGTLTIHKGSYVYIAHNTLNEGALGLGPLDAGAGLENKSDRLAWVVIEENTVNATVKVGHGTDHVSIRNNVIRDDDGVAIDVPGYSSDYQRGTSDVYILRNTVLNNGTSGKFMKVGGAVNGFTVCNNLYVAPKFVTGDYSSAPMQINTGDLSGFKMISDNIWPMPTITLSAGGGINFVGTSSTMGNNYKTPQEWEAYKQVVHDQYKDVSLTTSYKVSLGGITAGADMKKAA